MPMTAETALDALHRELAECGFDESAPSLRAVWTAVRSWAAVPVDGLDAPHADRMLYETDHSLRPAAEGASPPYYWIGFTRQFLQDDEAGYETVDQIIIACWFDLNPDFLEAVELRRQDGFVEPGWGDAGVLDRAWRERVDRDPGLAAGFRHVPRAVRIS